MAVNGKDSVATQWANMVAAAAAGEVVAIADKHGNDVAVMISKEKWIAMTTHSHLWTWNSSAETGTGGGPPASASCRCGMTYGDWEQEVAGA